LDNIIKPYVKKDKFLLILDSWGGQINPALYDKKFVDENDEPTCSLKIIPLKYTPLCQPCDVYFYRQVKNYIAKFQNCPVIIAANRELSSREDYKNTCTHTQPITGTHLQKYGKVCVVCCRTDNIT
jgi:hypothetical protein